MVSTITTANRISWPSTDQSFSPFLFSSAPRFSTLNSSHSHCHSHTATFLSRNSSMYQSKIISDYMQAMIPIGYNNFRNMFLRMMNISIHSSYIKEITDTSYLEGTKNEIYENEQSICSKMIDPCDIYILIRQ